MVTRRELDADPPGKRRRKAWHVEVRGWDECNTPVFASTAGKARVQVWHQMDAVNNITDIVARRWRERDMFFPVRDPEADQLTVDEQHCLLHAFGGNDDPDKAGYRDYFVTRIDDPPLVGLWARGLMSIRLIPSDSGDGNKATYLMTPRGKEVALSMVREYRR